MTNTNRLCYVFIFIVILVIGYYSSIKQQNHAKNNSVGNTSDSTKSDFISLKDQEVMSRVESQHPKLDQTHRMKDQLRIGFKRAHSIGNYFNRESLIKKEFLQILEDQESVEMAVKILLDNPYAVNAFGEEQALMRVYSIKLLETEAESGNPEHLLNTVSLLADQLNDKLNIGEDLVKGQLQDLDDLLNASIRYFFKKGDISDLDRMLMRMGFSKGFSQAIMDRYQDALFYPLKRLYGREAAVKIVNNISKK